LAALAGVGLGCLLAAVQLLPLTEAVPQSSRAGPVAGTFLVHTQLAFRYAERFIYPSSGAFGLVLLPLAVFWRKRVELAWAAAVVWSLAALFPPLVWVYHLPGFSSVRAPVGWPLIGSVFVAFLMAAGAGGTSRPAWLRVVAWGIAGAVLVKCAIDIACAPGSLRYPAPDYLRADQRAGVIKAVAGEARFVASDVAAGSNLRYELRSAGGFDPSMPPRRTLRLAEEIGVNKFARFGPKTWNGIARNPDLAALLGLGVVVAPKRAGVALQRAGFTRHTVLPDGDEVWFRPPMPRVRLVHEVLVVTNESEALSRILRTPELSSTVAIVERDELGSTRLEPHDLPATGTARLVQDRGDDVLIEVTTTGAGVLVMTDTAYPGWRAWVNGEPARILRVNFAFRGVVVPAGMHQVKFRYRPTSFVTGLAISSVTAVLLAGMSVIGWARKGVQDTR
jgi:hypothetical protein